MKITYWLFNKRRKMQNASYGLHNSLMFMLLQRLCLTIIQTAIIGI